MIIWNQRGLRWPSSTNTDECINFYILKSIFVIIYNINNFNIIEVDVPRDNRAID